MCCVRVGNQKLQARWIAEQNKRQRVLRHEKTGFCFVGTYYFNYLFHFQHKIKARLKMF